MNSIVQNRIVRPQLLHALTDGLVDQDGFTRPLSVVSAPAGYGKTICLRQWVDTLPSMRGYTV